MKLDRTSMLYGTLVLTLTSIVSQFLGFVYRIFLSRLIGAEVMGLYQLIMPVFSVLLSLTAVGLTAAVSNLSSQYHAMGRPAVIGQVLRRCLERAGMGPEDLDYILAVKVVDSLEDAMESYRKGKEYYAICSKKLQEAKQLIQIYDRETDTLKEM